MLTLPSLVCHYLYPNTCNNNIVKINHPFQADKYRENDFPQSAQFLDFSWTQSGLSGQLKGKMSGLKPLELRNYIHVDKRCFKKELALKKALLHPTNKYFSAVTAGLNQRNDAQKELLQIILVILKKHHQNDFIITDDTVRIVATGDIYEIGKFSESPLILAGLLVQEDFIIVERRREGANGANGGNGGNEGNGADAANGRNGANGATWNFACGVAAFSFAELGINGERGFMTPGASLSTIHNPVPGFNPHLHNNVTKVFETLRTSVPMWRANWLVTPMEEITPYVDDMLAPEDKEERPFAEGQLEMQDQETTPLLNLGDRPISELGLRVEHQTIIKLPSSDCVCFGIHSYIDPLTSLVRSPRAAEMIARATRSFSEDTIKYRGLGDQSISRIIQYLDGIGHQEHQ